MSTAAEKQFARRLGTALKGLPAPLSTGGVVAVEEQPAIALKASKETFVVQPTPEVDDGTRGERRERRMNDQVDALKGLTQQLPAAAFGHGKETKRDPSVRQAKQLPASEFDANISDGIKRQIQEDLALETDIVLEPYSLNVYEAGGHFSRHKDTPRDGQIGTLVVCLPSLFDGGALCVATGTDKYFDPFFDDRWPERLAFIGPFWGAKDWGGAYGVRAPLCDKDKTVEFNPKCIAWCAFFADAEHYVWEVEKGVRVTLAYSIRRTKLDAPQRLPAKSGNEIHSIIEQEMQKAFGSEDFLAAGGRLGCPCTHLYVNTDAFVDQNKAVLVANAAASLGFKVYLAPYLSMDDDAQGDVSDLPLDKMPEKRLSCPGYMSQEDVETFFDGDYGGHDCMSSEAMPWKHADLWMLDYGDSAQKKHAIGGTEYSLDGYFGNEATSTSFYVSCVLFIDIPAYADRSKQNA